jgi:hypothetical protein
MPDHLRHRLIAIFSIGALIGIILGFAPDSLWLALTRLL